MNKKTRQAIVYSVFVLVLIWGYFNFFGSENIPQPLPIPTHQAAITPGAVPQDIQTDGLTAEIIRDYHQKDWGKNPFYNRYKTKKELIVEEKARLHLLGIIYREIDAQALINGRVVSVGDTLEGYRVASITRKEVVLQKGVQTVKLKAKKESS